MSANFEAIPKVTENNTVEVLEKLKRNIELLTGMALKGDPRLRAVLNRDMLNAGLGELSQTSQLKAPSVAGNAIDIIDSGSLQNAASYDSPTLNSDYRAYVFVFDNLLPATDNVALWLRLYNSTSSSPQAGASAYSFARNISTFLAAGATTFSGSEGSSAIVVCDSVGNVANQESVAGIIEIPNPAAESKRTKCTFRLTHRAQDSIERTVSGGGYRLATESNNSFHIKFSSGNIVSMNYTLYGYKAK